VFRLAEVRYEQATRVYPGNDVPAVDGLDLEIGDGEFVVFVGPSGSGKTTALRMLAGLEEVDAGAIFIGDRDITDVAPKDRDVAMVFQNYALYPYLTVAANIAFPLKIAKMKAPERERRVRAVAEMLGLADLLERKPGQLSGGQRQRVAMGRAIVREPRVFLMDEPLSNLDAQLRVQMRADIAALQARLGVTTVYVTHDQSEAMTLGHRVAVLKDGRLQQFDAPRVLYNEPANTFVAGFIGSPSMNLLTVPVANGSFSFGGVDVAVPDALRPRSELVVGVRPECVDVTYEGLDAVVEVVEEIGADVHVFCAAELGGETKKLVARVATQDAPEAGERVKLRPRFEHAHFFAAESGERLEPQRPDRYAAMPSRRSSSL
jgi:multiple sugar transport system ATP-binding protein